MSMSRTLRRILAGSALLAVPAVCLAQKSGSERKVLIPSFVDSGQRLGTANSSCVVLDDVDRDGDLDGFVANGEQPSTIWLNDGKGSFAKSEQKLGNGSCAALGDLDGDGDLDVFMARSGENTVLLNGGRGGFTDTQQELGTMNSSSVVLGDLDRDGDLDALVTNWGNQPRTVWLNDGRGAFKDSGQQLSSAYYNSRATLADVDGDGDLDVFASDNAAEEHKPVPNRVWLNDGHGVFADSGQRLGKACSYAAALGDLDGDGDLDAFVANSSHAGANPVNKVWLNGGKGTFTDSGQRLGRAYSMDVALGDLDGDGDLDSYVGNYQVPDRVWLNDGSGRFADCRLELGRSNGDAVALGDLDGDGDIDAFVANNTWQGGEGANTVWLNQVKWSTDRSTGPFSPHIPPGLAKE
ncbi:MAG: FG-GAP-like repeat-containing protein [Planctomycetota bacterium]